VAAFVPWLRGTARLRSASVVAAAEYVRAGGPSGRRVIAAACDRADEPAEVLAYWTSRYGRAVPQPVKRGVADAAARLFTERAALRYDGHDRPWRMADVLELAHVRRTGPAQSALFGWLLDRRHGRAATDPGRGSCRSGSGPRTGPPTRCAGPRRWRVPWRRRRRTCRRSPAGPWCWWTPRPR